MSPTKKKLEKKNIAKTPDRIVTAKDSSMFAKDSKLYVCSCGGEALAVEFDNDPEWSDCCYCCISLWSNRSFQTPSFWSQLHHIWCILTKGHPYVDSVILTKDQFEDLKSLINKH